MRDYCLIYTLSTPWDNYHREQFIKSIANLIKEDCGYILCIEPTILSIFNVIKYPGRVIKWLKGQYRFRKVHDNIYAVPAKTFEHILLAVRFKLIGSLNRYLLRKQVDKLITQIESKINKKILILHRPELHYLVGAFGEIGVVYDCCDDYCSTSNMNPLKVIGNQKREKILSEKCNFVIVTSEKLFARHKSYNTNTFLIENGFGYKIPRSVNLQIKKYMGLITKPIIGYIGNIRSWIDFDLLEYVIRKCYDRSFVFVGSVDKDSRKMVARMINRYKNIHLTGRVEYNDVPQYLKYLDVGIIPFKVNEFMESANPNKFYEYLGSGVPVVTTNIGDIKNKYSDIAKVALTKDEFVSHIESLVDLPIIDTKQLKKKIIEIGKNHNWEEKSKYFNKLIRQHILHKNNNYESLIM